MWAEGRSEWQPLTDIPEMAPVIATAQPPATAPAQEEATPSAPVAAQSTADVARDLAAGPTAVGQNARMRAAVVVAAPARAVTGLSAAGAEDALAAFTAEISAIEQVMDAVLHEE